jgi:hypothetical protein
MNKRTDNESSFASYFAEKYPEFIKDPYSWATMVERYEDDVKNWGGSSQMLRLVRWLAAQEFSSMFSPYTSHMVLCISTKARCENQKKSDMVSVWYDQQLDAFCLKYYKTSPGKPEGRRCKESEVCHILELKLLRMKVVAETAV